MADMTEVKTLKDTVSEMCSDDYKERFKAEVHQLKIRYDGLENMLNKWDKEELNFTPTCSKDIFISQLEVMKEYLSILEHRAEIENIVL